MKARGFILKAAVIIFLSVMTGCTKDISNENGNGSSPPIGGNKPPIANAGPDEIVLFPADSAPLDGSASADLDGTIDEYNWTKISGPNSIFIDDPTASSTMARKLTIGTYVFQLRVKDNKGAAAFDTKMIVVSGPIECDISNLPTVNATLQEIGFLHAGQAPFVAVSGDKIFFAGGAHGYGGVDIYDTKTGQWAYTELSVPRTNLSVASCGGKVFFAGGNNGDYFYDIIDIYDVAKGTWTQDRLSEPRSFAGAGAIGDKVFFAGGITEEGTNQSRSIDIYDISENAWSKANLTNAKTGVTVVTAGNKIYFAGGANYLTGIGKLTLPGFTEVDIYDITTDSWSGAILHEIRGEVSAVVNGDFIYWGGLTAGGGDSKGEVWDTRTGHYFNFCLSYPRTHPTAAVSNNKVVYFSTGLVGPMVSAFDLSDQFDIYDIATGNRVIGKLDNPIAGAAVVSVNNVIYVAGGLTKNGYTGTVYTLTW